MPGYDSDEFESSDGDSPKKQQFDAAKNGSSTTSPTAGGGGGAAGKSPTTMSAFGNSLGNTGRSNALPFGMSDGGGGPFSSLDGPSSNSATTNANTRNNAGGGGGGFVAPTPAMDTAEEAIAKVLEGKIWMKQYDANSKKYYYYHRLTKQTTWDLAKELGFGPDGRRISAAANDNASTLSPSASNAALNHNNNNDKQQRSIVSAAGSDNSSSNLPPDPLLAKGGSGYRYSGFVTGAGFGGGSESTSFAFGGGGGGGGKFANATGTPSLSAASAAGGAGAGAGGASRDSTTRAREDSAPFGDFGGYVAFGRGGTPSASASPTSTPRAIVPSDRAADFPSSSSTNQRALQVASPLVPSTVVPPSNTNANVTTATGTATSAKADVVSSAFAETIARADTAAKAMPSSFSDAPASTPSPEGEAAIGSNKNLNTTVAPTTNTATTATGGAAAAGRDEDEESSAFSTFSGAAARIAAENKAKADAALEAEKKKLAAEREQQAKSAAEAMAKMGALRGRAGGVTLETMHNTAGGGGPLTSPLGGGGAAVGALPVGLASSTLASPLGATLGPLNGTNTNAAASLNVGSLMMNSGAGAGGLGAASPLYGAVGTAAPTPVVGGGVPPLRGLNSLASPLLSGTIGGGGGGVGLTSSTNTLASPLTYQQQVQMSQQLQQQMGGAQQPPSAAPKTELLQTAEALERLVKAFVVLKNGSDGGSTAPKINGGVGAGGLSPFSPSSRRGVYEDANDYDTLLRAARFKHSAAQSRDVLTSHTVPTRGRYLTDTMVSSAVPPNPLGMMPSDMGPMAAMDYAQRCADKAARDANNDLLETEILDTVIAMMTADEGRSMWLNAGDATRAQIQQQQQQQQRGGTVGGGGTTADANILAAQQKKAGTTSSRAREPLIDVVSIDQYRTYTLEGAGGGGMMGRSAVTNNNPSSSSGGVNSNNRKFLNSIPSASRFHVDAFDTMTGAFVPGSDTPLLPTASTTPTPLGNLLEENLEKYLLKHVVPVRGRGMLPSSAMLPDGNIMPVITPHLARMVLLDLLRLCIDITVTRFSTSTPSTLPINGRDPIVLVYEGPLGSKIKSRAASNGTNNKENVGGVGVTLPNGMVSVGGTADGDDSSSSRFSPARFLIEACKRTVQSLPFELLSIDTPSSSSSTSPPQQLTKPRFRLEHWVTKPHMYAIIHALQWTLRKLERRANDPYADFFGGSSSGGGGSASVVSDAMDQQRRREALQQQLGIDVADLDGEWSRVYASEMPFFSLAPPQFLSTTRRAAEAVAASGLNTDTADANNNGTDGGDVGESLHAQTERELTMLLQGQVPHQHSSSSMGIDERGRAFPSNKNNSSTANNPLFARDYFGLDGDHLEVMAYAASTIGLDVFRSIAGANGSKGEAEKDGQQQQALKEGTANTAATADAAAAKKADAAAAPSTIIQPPRLPLAVKQEIALQCTVACIEELLGDTKILDSIKRRATNKASALIEERNKSWAARHEQGQRALKAGADFVELEAKRRRDEVAAAEKRIGLMVDRMKEEINRQM